MAYECTWICTNINNTMLQFCFTACNNIKWNLQPQLHMEYAAGTSSAQMADALRGNYILPIRTWLTSDISWECVLEFWSLIRQHASSTDELPSPLHNPHAAFSLSLCLSLQLLFRSTVCLCERAVKVEKVEDNLSPLSFFHPGYLVSHQAGSLHLTPCFLLYHFFILPVLSAHCLPVVSPFCCSTGCNSHPGEILLS